MFTNLLKMLLQRFQAPVEAVGKIPLDGTPRTRLTNMRVTKEVATTEIRRGSRVDVYARVRSQRVPSTESKQYAKSAQA